jgi:hypothetical protein
VVRISVAFLSVFILGAAGLLLSQYWGVKKGLYQTVLRVEKKWLWTRPWLSHDLIFLLLSVSCWDEPFAVTELGFIPGLPPMSRWQLPFALSAFHVMLSGNLHAVYAEAIAMSIPVHIISNMIPTADTRIYSYLTAAGGAVAGQPRGWDGAWQRPHAE